MQAATILPTNHLHLIRSRNYHMCLAQLIGIDQKYTEFYKEQAKKEDSYVIMDNGVIEGDCRPIEEIVKKALMIGADEIILPDVFVNQAETLDKSYRALRYVKDNFPLKLMAVPQGKTFDEWMDCAIAMIDWDIDCIGIPKVLVKIAGRDGRLAALELLGNKLRGLDIHLLGCWTTPLEVLFIERAVKDKKIRPVRGVDSAIAYVYTRAGLNITDQDRPDSNPIHFSTEYVTNEELLIRNINCWEAACEIADDDLLKLW
jgi:hypothetical protein